jgi:hypothetical protein
MKREAFWLGGRGLDEHGGEIIAAGDWERPGGCSARRARASRGRRWLVRALAFGRRREARCRSRQRTFQRAGGGVAGARRPERPATEKPKPEWRQFLDEYRSYMQIILVIAGVVSLIIAAWGTAVLLFLLTVLNAVVGMREEGKAESAMNALKSMMKQTARVRREGTRQRSPRNSWSSGISC